MAEDVRFREYLAVMEDTAKLSDRRQTVSDLFVGINSLFLTAAGFVAGTTQFTTWRPTALCAAITLVTLVFNSVWLQLIARYRALTNLRIRYLTGLEKSLQADGIFSPLDIASEDGKKVEHALRGVYGIEADSLYRQAPKVGFYRLERRFIIVFMIAYPLLTAAVAAVSAAIIVFHLLPPLSVK
jgi:hypothetical protein